jgi:eukaryotic-like serine/threonine-protein kinase
MAGMQLGAYTTIRKLGAGGMGEVYLAQHRHLARRAAIKVLLPEMSHNEELLSRFFTEARTTSSLDHPAIVEVFDCDVLANGQAYIVMEYLVGETLGSALGRAPDFSRDVRRLAAIIGEVADALALAHASGIVHRDLKPENVFLAVGRAYPSSVDVKILDFGIAKLVDEKAGHAQTRTGSLLGTPVYMSPEQCRGARKIDHRSDIYSLGCMAFEMLCGQPPFVRAGAGELLVAHIAEAPPRVESLRPDAPRALANLIASMLIKEPERRLQSMTEVVAAVERLVGVPAALLPALVAPPNDFPGTLEEAGPMGPASRAAKKPITAGSGPVGPVSSSGPATRAAVGRPAIGVEAPVLPDKQTTLGASASAMDVPAWEEPSPKRRGVRPWQILLPLAAVAGVVLVATSSSFRSGAAPGSAPAEVGPVAAPAPAPAPPVAAPPKTPVPAPPAKITIQITSSPAGAEVWLPDEHDSRGRTPVSLELPRGTGQQAVILKAAGFAEKNIRFDRSRDGSASVELRKLESKAEKPRGDKPNPKATKAKPRSVETSSGYRTVGD